MTKCELNISTTISHKTNTKEQISRSQSFLMKPTFTTNHKQDSTKGVHIHTKIYTYSEITEGYGLCFACELQFNIDYPGLGIPVLVIVYLISYLKFT